MSAPLELHGVVHLVRPTGATATRLRVLRAGVLAAPASSLFFHTLQPALRHPGAQDLPPDDFSAWIGGVLQDRETAERVAFAVQGVAPDLEALRGALVAALDAGAERDTHACPPESAFVFLDADAVPVPLGVVPEDCDALVEQLAVLAPSVFFHHLVEEPWFDPAGAPLPAWVRAQGQARLAEWCAACARASLPLAESRSRLVRRWRRTRLPRRVADASTQPASVRHDDAQRVLRRIVRRAREAGRDARTDE